MRTKLELWQLVDRHFDEYFYIGLCNVIWKLRAMGLININEWESLVDEIEHIGNTEDYFLGEKGDAKPRKEFTQKRIKAHGGFRQ
jgi:hypothetical protein